MPPEFALVLALVAGLGVIVWSLISSYRSQSKRRLIEALPTSATQGVFIGFVEVKGSAESPAPLRTYLAECAAVYYRWSIDEHWERWETEYYTDSEGRQQSRQVHKSGWTTVDSGGQSQPFYLRDETGAILVRPTGADVRGVTVFNRYCGRGDSLYYGKGPSGSIGDSTHERRFHETAIVLHEELYVVGQAREREDIVAAEIAAQEAVPMYLVTAESEEQVHRRLGRSAIGWALFGMILCGAAGAATGRIDEERIFRALIGAGIYLSLLGIGRLVLLYNSLVDTRNRMRQGFSQIDVQLQRRKNLIPNLVAAVEKHAAHEKEVQTLVAELRTEAKSTAPGLPGANPRALSGKVGVLVERYPALGADESFGRLQRELIDTEQRIALARSYFNDIATEWNNRVEQFPDTLIAKLCRFRRQHLFEATDFERAAIDVDFAD